MSTALAETRTDELLQISDAYGAHNYHPLPVVIESGKGCYVTDVDGKRYKYSTLFTMASAVVLIDSNDSARISSRSDRVPAWQ